MMHDLQDFAYNTDIMANSLVKEWKLILNSLILLKYANRVVNGTSLVYEAALMKQVHT